MLNSFMDRASSISRSNCQESAETLSGITRSDTSNTRRGHTARKSRGRGLNSRPTDYEAKGLKCPLFLPVFACAAFSFTP